jgi:hypothetical protein
MNTCDSCLWWLPNRPEFRLANVPWCLHSEINAPTVREVGCERHTGREARVVNVPQHLRKGESRMTNDAMTTVDGPVEILIVTYGTPTVRCSGKVVSDFDWLVYCLRSIQKFCRGFSGVTVAVPEHERAGLDAVLKCVPDAPLRIQVRTFDEPRGKGMLNHMAMMASADQLVPEGTKYVLHMDADGVFTMPTTPEHYFISGPRGRPLPYYLVRTWDSLTTEDPRNPGSKCVSDCAQWREPTEAQLGFTTEFYTMCMNTNVFPIEFYEAYRGHIERQQHQPFLKYMLSGRNEFPQDRMDHTAMGAWAHKYMRERFEWIDVEAQAYPADRKLAFWSHGGITPEIQAQIEEILK